MKSYLAQADYCANEGLMLAYEIILKSQFYLVTNNDLRGVIQFK